MNAQNHTDTSLGEKQANLAHSQAFNFISQHVVNNKETISFIQEKAPIGGYRYAQDNTNALSQKFLDCVKPINSNQNRTKAIDNIIQAVKTLSKGIKVEEKLIKGYNTYTIAPTTPTAQP
ncbi:MAG: hypothetical protein KTR28_01425 [Micavibrio sp.]|nr:hypothetical protein [Micavibrio sp.]